ncbi:MAG: hypothetical protein M0R48_06970, partial [Candidatus Omnitrophica bacterium]|nr:hypothetical protein [Candidatus Omnitrophota bacterium]
YTVWEKDKGYISNNVLDEKLTKPEWCKRPCEASFSKSRFHHYTVWEKDKGYISNNVLDEKLTKPEWCKRPCEASFSKSRFHH